MAVNFVPEGYHNVVPYVMVKDAGRMIEFLTSVFGAKELERHLRPDGSVMHAEVKIGDSIIMMSDGNEKWKVQPFSLYVYVPDANAVYQRAMDAGSKSLMEPADQIYGDRNAGVSDPFGNVWWIATHVEDVSREEMERRMKEHKAA